MASYLIRRLAMLPFVALGVTLLLFALLQLLSPEMRASLYITDPRQLSALESIIETYHLRDPFPVQYWTWLKQVFVGERNCKRANRRSVTPKATKGSMASLRIRYEAMIATSRWLLCRGDKNHWLWESRETQGCDTTP